MASLPPILLLSARNLVRARSCHTRAHPLLLSPPPRSSPAAGRNFMLQLYKLRDHSAMSTGGSSGYRGSATGMSNATSYRKSQSR